VPSTNDERSAAFTAFFLESFAKLEAAAQEAGAGFEARAGDGQVRLQTTDGRQQLVFRRAESHLEVIFYDRDHPDAALKARENWGSPITARLGGATDRIIARWLDKYGPGS
jgi:hypothetical protein